MTNEERDLVFAEGFRAGWAEAIKALQNLELPPVTAAQLNEVTEEDTNEEGC